MFTTWCKHGNITYEFEMALFIPLFVSYHRQYKYVNTNKGKFILSNNLWKSY